MKAELPARPGLAAQFVLASSLFANRREHYVCQYRLIVSAKQVSQWLPDKFFRRISVLAQTQVATRDHASKVSGKDRILRLVGNLGSKNAPRCG
jgi:hypothetical protein